MQTNLTDAIPYQGDDWAQKMAKTMATPMVLMGLMTVLGGFVLGIVGGVGFGDFFSPTGVPADLGRAESLAHLAPAVTFAGMGLVLGGVTMSLVNVARNLRDSGRDVQTALAATPLQLRKPWTGKLTPSVMMMGVMTELAALVVGVVAASAIGGVSAADLAGGSLAGGDLADVGTARAFAAWLPGLRLLGVAVILGSIVLALLTIHRSIRFQGERITGLATAGPVEDEPVLAGVS